MTTTHATKQFYKKTYNRLHRLGYHRDTEYSHAIPLCEYLVDELEFASVLDIGCSVGVAVDFFQQNGKDAHGIDVSDVAVRKAKKLGRNVQLGEATALPYEDGTFDLVVSTDCFEHLLPEDVDAAVGEAVRVSNRYLALKINPRRDRNKLWRLVAMNDLHQTLMPVSAWIDRFKQFGCDYMYSVGEGFVLEKKA